MTVLTLHVNYERTSMFGFFTTVLSFDIVAVDEINFNSIQFIQDSYSAGVKANIYEISSDTHQLHYIPLYHFTILSYYLTRYVGRKEILNTKNNDFNRAAIFEI